MKRSTLGFLTVLFLLLGGINFTESIPTIEDEPVYRIEINLPEEPEKLWNKINEMDTPIINIYENEDETTIYANDEYYSREGYDLGETYSNTKPGDNNFKVNSYYQTYNLTPINKAMTGRDVERFSLLFHNSSETEFLNYLGEIEKDFIVISYSDYAPNEEQPFIKTILVVEIFLLLLAFLLELYGARESFSYLKGMGISKWRIGIYQLKKSMWIYISFTILLSIINFVYLTLKFTLSTTNIMLCKDFVINQLIFLLVLYIVQFIITMLFLSTRNIVNELKNGNAYRNIQNVFTFVLFLSKLLFICFLIIFSLQMPQMIDVSKVYFEWNKVKDYSTVVINNYYYLNGEKNYESDYYAPLDDIERMNVIHYFEENYNGAYIIGDKAIYEPLTTTDDWNSSLLQANYNYLELINFPEISEVNKERDTLLVPIDFEQDQDFQKYIAEKSKKLNGLNLEIVTYDDFAFYSYDDKADYNVGENGYLNNPLLFIPSATNNNARIYTIPFQEFFYLDERDEAINKYYQAYDINVENVTNSDSKYSEYSTLLHTMLMRFALIITNLVFVMMLYISTLRIYMDVYIKSNKQKLSLLTTLGVDNFSKYKLVYIENVAVSIASALIFVVGIIYTSIDLALVIEMISFIIIDILYITRIIKKFEKQKVLIYIKGGA